MKTRLSILLLLTVMSLVMVNAVVAQPDRAAATNPPALPSAMVTDEVYHLENLRWQFDGTAHGGLYQLLSPQQPTLRGNGCCCTFLPCLQR